MTTPAVREIRRPARPDDWNRIERESHARTTMAAVIAMRR
jgi:hypothetical protein